MAEGCVGTAARVARSYMCRDKVLSVDPNGKATEVDESPDNRASEEDQRPYGDTKSRHGSPNALANL